MASRGFNLPEFPPRLPPFLREYQSYAPRDYEAYGREQSIQNARDAMRKTKEAYTLLEEIHDLVKGMGVQYTQGKAPSTARDYSAAAISAVGGLNRTLEEEISRRRAGRR